jgi:hypothetical protein
MIRRRTVPYRIGFLIGCAPSAGSAPSGSSNMREAAHEIDDGGDAHYCHNPRAIHAKRGAASTHARSARLDCVTNALARFIPQKGYVRGHHEEDREGPRPPSR